MGCSRVSFDTRPETRKQKCFLRVQKAMSTLFIGDDGFHNILLPFVEKIKSNISACFAENNYLKILLSTLCREQFWLSRSRL